MVVFFLQVRIEVLYVSCLCYSQEGVGVLLFFILFCIGRCERWYNKGSQVVLVVCIWCLKGYYIQDGVVVCLGGEEGGLNWE